MQMRNYVLDALKIPDIEPIEEDYEIQLAIALQWHPQDIKLRQI